MTDPQQSTGIPTDDQTSTETGDQGKDFFGGGEEAFQEGVLNPNDGTVIETQPVYQKKPEPETTTREPTLPTETKAEDVATISLEEENISNEGGLSQTFEPTIDGEAAPIPWTPEPISSPILDAEQTNQRIEDTPKDNDPGLIIPSAEEQKDNEVPTTIPTDHEMPTMITAKIDTAEEQKDDEVSTTIPTKVDTTGEQKEDEHPHLSDLGKKLMTLIHLCKHIQDRKRSPEGFSIIGADNEKVHILYTFVLGDPEFPMISVIKKEIDKTERDQDEEEENIHELSFYLNESGTLVNINLNDDLLFEEEIDLQEDTKQKMQVMEKINKFIFLVTEESKKIEKEAKQREAEMEEKKKLQDIFRNF